MPRSQFGHIQKLAKGKYRAHWQEGNRKRSKRCSSYKEATETLARMRIHQGSSDFNINYNEYYQATIVPGFKVLSKRTKYESEYAWRNLQPMIGNLKVAKTTWRTVQNTLDTFPSYARQEKALKLWRKMLNFAVKDEILRVNPVTLGITLKKPKHIVKQLYTKDELVDVLHKVDGTDFALPILLECCCGLRHEEFCGLNNKDFNYDHDGWIIITIERALTEVQGKKVLKETKTETSNRVVVLHKDFLPYLLRNNKSMKNKRYVKEYRAPGSYRACWSRYCKNNDIRYVPFGHMRSVYATLCSEGGCLDSVVSKSMGHSGATVKERNYQTATMKALMLNAELFANYIGFNY